jgi:hypothetical protein
MPFIKLSSGSRVNIDHIVSYTPAAVANGGGSWLETVTDGPTGESVDRIDETPEELDALISLAEDDFLRHRTIIETLAMNEATEMIDGPIRTCRICGCTDDHACPEGCSWVEEDLCSACELKVGDKHVPASL